MKNKIEDDIYKQWLQDQIADDPTITVECVHCGENIELGDGGFMSWSYDELAEHMENCDSAKDELGNQFVKRHDGFKDSRAFGP